jgi:hypothetical protein
MKKSLMLARLLAVMSALPGFSAVLTLQKDTVTPVGSFFNYSYQFAVSGAGAAVDNIFLGSNDLSPLNVVIMVDSAPTIAWSWLGNDTPQNYLQFFDFAGTALGNGDVLDVTFTSSFAPASTEFAEGLNSTTDAATNTVTGVLAPNAVPASTPEPGTMMLLASGVVLVAGRRYLNRIRP